MLYIAMRCHTVRYVAFRWLYAAIQCFSSLCAAIRRYVLPYVAIHSCALLCAAIRCYTLLYVVIRCYTLLHPAVRCFLPLCVAIHRYMLLFAAIRCYARLHCLHCNAAKKKKFFWNVRCLSKPAKLL